MRAIGWTVLAMAAGMTAGCAKGADPTVCTAATTVAGVKRIVFDQARQKFRGDAGPIDSLDRDMVASIVSAFVATRPGSDQTDCQGQLRIEIPAVLRDRFDGSRFLISTVRYSIDRGGAVTSAQGFFAALGQILGAAEAMRSTPAPLPAVVAPAFPQQPAPQPQPGAEAGAAAPVGRSYYIVGLDPNGDNWLALKAAPDLRAARLAKLGPDTLLASDGERVGDWLNVRTPDGRQGWVAARYTACCR